MTWKKIGTLNLWMRPVNTGAKMKSKRLCDGRSGVKPLNAIHHSALRFIAIDGFRTHQCLLYEKAGWLSLAVKGSETALHSVYLQSISWQTT